MRSKNLIPLGFLALVATACAGGTAQSPAGTSAAPTPDESTSAPASVTAPPTPSLTPEPTQAASGPSESGETVWFELNLQSSGQLTGGDDDSDNGFHEGHVFRAGTLDTGETVRLELPEFHAFADNPRGGKILVGSDDEESSEVQVADAMSGETASVTNSGDIIWGATLSPATTEMYYVLVDRKSMTDAGLWRLSLETGSEPEQVIEQITPAEYDYASQLEFAWSPNRGHLVTQYCRTLECRAHVMDVSTGDSQVHDAPGVSQLRGATDTEYITDAAANEQRSGILGVDLETLEVRTLTEEWGVSEVHDTSDGPLLVYLAPDQPVREQALIGIWLNEDVEPFVLYEDRDIDTPPEHEMRPRGGGYEAPQDQMLLWAGTLGSEGDPDTWEPEFLLMDLITGESQTFPYEFSPPR